MINTYFKILIINYFLLGCFFALSGQSADSLAQILADSAQQINNKGSLPFLEEAFSLCALQGCADSTIARLYQRKSVAYYLGVIDFDLSLSYTDSAIHYYELAYGTNHFITANSQFNKGAIQNSLGRNYEGKESIEMAIDNFDKASLPTALNKDSILLNWRYVIMKIDQDIGDYNAALKLGKSLAKSEALFPLIERGIISTTGLLYLDQAKYLQAKKIYSDYIDAKGEKVNIVFKINLGLAHLALNELELAEFRLTDAHNTRLARFSSLASRGNKVFLSNSHANLLQLYLQKKEHDKAEYHYSEALRLLLEVDSTGHLPRFAEIYFKKAKLEYALDRYDSSLSFLQKAMNVVAPELAQTGADENITLIGPFKRVLEIIGFRARVLASQGQPEEALKDVMLLNRLVTQSRRTYQSSLSKYYLIQEVVPVYELGIQLNRQLYAKTGRSSYLEQAYALNARNKAILLLESLQSDRAMTFAGLPLDVQEREKELRDALTEQERVLYSAYQNDEAIDSLQAEVFKKEQAYHRFIQQLEDDYPAYYQLKYSADRPPLVAYVQNQLDDDQAMIEYFVGQDSIYTFLLAGKQMEVFSKAVPLNFADSVELFRELLTNGISEDCESTFIHLSRYFYDLLLEQPLAGLSNDKNRLVIIPDGLLNYLSFEALLYRDIDRLAGAAGFVIERYACSYAYSSKLLLEDYYPRSASKGFGGFGMEYDDYTLNYLRKLDYGKPEEVDTTFQLPCGLVADTTRYLGKLSYSDDEVRSIAELTHGDSWLNEQVTKKAFLQAAGDYKLLHMAMHGSYDMEFPMNSSLIFTRTDSADVFLRAAEIYGMELSGEMIALSACNTAYGKLQAGEGPMTLARAFHYAGIPSVIASLWSIPDNSASTIMKLFYQQLDQGLPKDVALQQAKLAYLQDDDISSPATRQPVHWAPAIVIGNVAPVPVGPSSVWWWVMGAVSLIGLMYFGLGKRTIA